VAGNGTCTPGNWRVHGIFSASVGSFEPCNRRVLEFSSIVTLHLLLSRVALDKIRLEFLHHLKLFYACVTPQFKFRFVYFINPITPMSEEPSLPRLPAVSWDEQSQTFSNNPRKRVRNAGSKKPRPVFSLQHLKGSRHIL